ncbi:MAG: type I 3-dehydroquinate dehydratase [Phycisphaerales bacterium]
MSTLVCVPITVHDADAALADARTAKAAGAELVEYRIDEFFSGPADTTPDILRIVAASPLPCIVTCRPAWGGEGGSYDGDDAARIALFERLGTAFGPGEHPPRYLDVEWSTLSRSANIRQKVRLAVEHPEQSRDLTTSLILSLHDFDGRPADLTRRLLAMRGESAARVLKVAYRCRSLRDNLELFDLLEHRDRPTIALGMGEFGLMSRVLAPKFGAFLTFASLRPTTTTAPGQPTIRELLDLYRFRSIGPATNVYGVVGWPVGHSVSPHVHNAGFSAINWPGVYLPLPIPGARPAATERDAPAHSDNAPADLESAYISLKATLVELVEHPRLSLRGVSVTIPHKENLVRLARDRGWSIDPVAARIGAANTLAVDRAPDGRPIAARVFNTDAPAIADCLRAALGTFHNLTLAVLGAGGVARAAAYAAAAEGARVIIFNRTRDHAEALCEDLTGLPGPVTPGGSHDLADPAVRAVVNATPVGMSGGPDPAGSPIPIDTLRARQPGSLLVLDTVYNPVLTPLLRAAAAHGHRTIDGVEVFTSQAARQFEAWTGTPPPTGLFDRVARETLAASS